MSGHVFHQEDTCGEFGNIVPAPSYAFYSTLKGFSE